MGEAFAWLGKIFEILTAFIPRPFIIDATCRGVKFKYGRKIVFLEPGVYVYWPLVTKVLEVSVVRQAVVLKPQVLVTKDGKSVVMGVLIVYEIADAGIAMCSVHNLDDTIHEVAEGAIPGIVSSRTLDQLIEALSNSNRVGKVRLNLLDKELVKSAKLILRDMGVKVLYCKITNFAPCFVLKNIGEPFSFK